MVIIAFCSMVFSSLSLAENIYKVVDGHTKLNGKRIKTKEFIFPARLINDISGIGISDELKIIVDESGAVEIKTKVYGSAFYLGSMSGQVEQFIDILSKAEQSAKYARFSKQSGKFSIGFIEDSLGLLMATSPGGSLRYFSIVVPGEFPAMKTTEHQITQQVIDGMISVLQMKDEIADVLNGETNNVKVVRLSMTKPDQSDFIGTALKISEQDDSKILAVDKVGFRLKISKANASRAKRDLYQALLYLHTANATLEDTPDKQFVISGLGAKPVEAKVKALDGNADRYWLSMKISGDGDNGERYLVLFEKQLIKLITVLSDEPIEPPAPPKNNDCGVIKKLFRRC